MQLPIVVQRAGDLADRVRARLTQSSRAKLAVAVALTLTLGYVLFLTYQYGTTKKPLPELPGVGPISLALGSKPPAYVQTIYGDDNLVLANPLGVAVSPKGDRVYTTESGADRVTLIFDRAGKSLGKLVPPQTDAGGRAPLYVAVDSSGKVYVSDRLRGVIDVYSAGGEHEGAFTPSSDPPAAPMALYFDKAGNFYVTDVPEGHHQLLVYDPRGNLTLRFGRQGTEAGEFSYPNGVATDAKGNIYVSDGNNGRVEIFSPEGNLVDVIGRGGKGTLGIPRGIVVDSLGRLHIVDTTGQTVEVWDVSASDPTRLYTIGSEGIGDSQFSYPNGIALDSTGRLYVTDRANSRLAVWSY